MCVCVCGVLVQWGSVQSRLAVATTDDVYVVSEHVMSLHCCGAVSRSAFCQLHSVVIGCIFFSNNLIDLDLHSFVRRVQSSLVKKNAPYHFGIADLRNSGLVPFSGFTNQTQW